jgi:hypothetical protein
VKRAKLLKILTAHGCVFVRHGKKHDVWQNLKTHVSERIPRHNDVNEFLAKSIIRKLS